MDLKRFKELPVMGILRGPEKETIEPLFEAVISSGLRTIEITMNTPDAPELIRRAVKVSGGRLTIGAGTVLTAGDLEKALDAGASFIVLPTAAREVVEACVKKSVPVFPGALTPQEIHNAWKMGVSMVKVFPAKFFGPGYFKEIKGPFADIELLACGGVTPENVRTFLSSGASAVAFGASIFKKDQLKTRNFKEIEKNIKALLAVLK